MFVIFSFVSLIVVGGLGFYYPQVNWLFALLVPIYLVGIHDLVQSKRSLLRNFPVVGHGRYWLEILRPKFYQYFVESDINGRPFSRIYRSIVYQRAKKQLDSNPFGTLEDVYEEGHEWINHSIYPINKSEHHYESRTIVGGEETTKKYNASLLNISAMSFGSLSTNAIMALNKGAKLGGFLHNTGEGGLSPYHLKNGGDITWQLGTGYFGARDEQGNFSPERFQEKALLENVRMIEIKLSQGAKPGKGGILPAAKNTVEIAAIRGVKPYTDVISPPAHTAFKDAKGLLMFVSQLRKLSGGKPVGFKLCVGSKNEFIEICEEMVKNRIYPDFITVDGSEGGTGAAPLEFTNSVGTPMKDGLTFVYNTLVGYDLKKHIKVIASGKIVTGFHMISAIALGADMCNSARGMMMALGCIQALSCNTNHCPVGIATQDPDLVRGLHVNDKSVRVSNFHHETVKSFEELLAAAGLKNAQELKRGHIYQRLNMYESKSFEEIYPYTKIGSLLKKRAS
ncbi:MAG: FMN-binding glutamate synthase family protein [Bacteriovoracaceae bacterium]|nr:FMN-binding glutamate synthase family protein [Bacteriovoracaceae bacterium]